MKQSAIDWLIDKHFGGIENCTPDFKKHIEQAKEMENQNIIEGFSTAYSNYSESEISNKQAISYYLKNFQNPNIIDEWLDKNGNKEIAKQVEQEIKQHINNL